MEEKDIGGQHHEGIIDYLPFNAMLNYFISVQNLLELP